MASTETDKLAVIDIGSNTIRLQVSEILEKTYRIVTEHKDLAKLGEVVFKHGLFNEEAFDRLDRAMFDIKTILDTQQPKYIRAVATASFREASNFKDVVKHIKETYDIDIEVIDGKLEAEITFLAASASFQLSKYRALIVDIGGGSTEFILSDFGKIEKIESIKTGCSIITDMFIKSDPISNDDYTNMKDYLAKEISSLDLDESIDIIICSGGSMNNIAVVHNTEKNLDTNAIVKFVDRKYLKGIVQTLRSKNIEERAKINGLEPKRADNILPAPLQIDIILDNCHCGGFFTLNGGLRTGLTIDTLNKLGIELPFQQNESDDVRYSRLLDIGNKFFFEEEHSLQVEKLSKHIFDGLKDILLLNDQDWKILQAAAVLHDIGQHISYSKHHKHSYYLIQNSQLLGYSRAEQEIIACIARYHRKSLPKPKHTEFTSLNEQSQIKVMKLAGILRTADALDRAHKSRITEMSVEIKRKDIKLITNYAGDLSMERRKLADKSDLLSKVTGREVILL